MHDERDEELSARELAAQIPRTPSAALGESDDEDDEAPEPRRLAERIPRG